MTNDTNLKSNLFFTVSELDIFDIMFFIQRLNNNRNLKLTKFFLYSLAKFLKLVIS